MSGRARGKERISGLRGHLGIHPATVIRHSDGQPVSVQVLDHGQDYAVSTGLDRVLDHVEDVQRQFAQLPVAPDLVQVLQDLDLENIILKARQLAVSDKDLIKILKNLLEDEK